jgi:hypothetical protein
VQRDRQFRVSGKWALATDGIQLVLQRRQGQVWQATMYIRSSKAMLGHCMRRVGVPPSDAARLLDGLPDTFSDWAAAGSRPVMTLSSPCHPG